jgi:hypothetical protein
MGGPGGWKRKHCSVSYRFSGGEAAVVSVRYSKYNRKEFFLQILLEDHSYSSYAKK